MISESALPNAIHEAVAALALAGQAIRIVTTNYDRLLSACLPEETPLFEAPNLPVDVDFTGVVHLHGSVGQTADRLVMTTTDFARSYIKQPSRVLVFLQQLFASRTVLFVGYSIKDTLMQYVLRAVTPGADLYTLTDKPEDPLWGTLGVTAVGCTSRGHLPVVLTEWPDSPAPRSKSTAVGYSHPVKRGHRRRSVPPRRVVSQLDRLGP